MLKRGEEDLLRAKLWSAGAASAKKELKEDLNTCKRKFGSTSKTQDDAQATQQRSLSRIRYMKTNSQAAAEARQKAELAEEQKFKEFNKHLGGVKAKLDVAVADMAAGRAERDEAIAAAQADRAEVVAAAASAD
eukprot:21704-Pleurochrysis_carterae.AAC.2